MSSSNSKGIKNVPPPDGGKPSPYNRFIPREELNSFSAWSPNQLGGSEPVRGVHRNPPPSEATPDRRAPSAGSEELAQLVHSARQQGYQDGYRDGMAALDSFKQSYAKQMSTQVGALVESLSAQLEDLQQDMARAMAVSATHLARQIVRSELQAHPALVAQVANEALEALLLSARHVTLRVHPDDMALVTEGAAQMLSARGGRVVGDTSLMRGSCMVESDIGVIDATVETRWRRAVAAIGCDEAWNAPPPVSAQPLGDLPGAAGLDDNDGGDDDEPKDPA
jgi:flagellar assembly protein FliH